MKERKKEMTLDRDAQAKERKKEMILGTDAQVERKKEMILVGRDAASRSPAPASEEEVARAHPRRLCGEQDAAAPLSGLSVGGKSASASVFARDMPICVFAAADPKGFSLRQLAPRGCLGGCGPQGEMPKGGKERKK